MAAFGTSLISAIRAAAGSCIRTTPLADLIRDATRTREGTSRTTTRWCRRPTPLSPPVRSQAKRYAQGSSGVNRRVRNPYVTVSFRARAHGPCLWARMQSAPSSAPLGCSHRRTLRRRDGVAAQGLVVPIGERLPGLRGDRSASKRRKRDGTQVAPDGCGGSPKRRALGVHPNAAARRPRTADPGPGRLRVPDRLGPGLQSRAKEGR